MNKFGWIDEAVRCGLGNIVNSFCHFWFIPLGLCSEQSPFLTKNGDRSLHKLSAERIIYPNAALVF